MFGGFDHNFALKGSGYRNVGLLTGDKTGIKMEIYTDKVGVQLYTGNMIEKGASAKTVPSMTFTVRFVWKLRNFLIF